MYFNLDSMLQAGHLLSQLVQVGFQKVLHLPKILVLLFVCLFRPITVGSPGGPREEDKVLARQQH